MRDVDVAPYATLIAASTPLLIAVAAGLWKVWTTLSRRKHPAEPEPTQVVQGQPLMTVVEQDRLVPELRRQIGGLEKKFRQADARGDWYRDWIVVHQSRHHPDEPIPEPPKETR